ncbi:MAG: hypothetical protein ACLU17_08695 [Phocaeicola vulgatus]|jgi:hypothetical protein|uniref:Glycosyltransferase RgtA/B/C/D-like domain-containing protein n=1 Tax=Phocaeicola dorei TaxID=357276 RepID=A0A4Q5HQM7_9BACT|nr:MULTISPECIES: hypothetical protein [Bacteroidales]EEO46257.1 hypothetical protein BSEG_02398 [Phocaeicola dorei 5_1_36/D4]KAA5393244.1 hypothetical protein F2Y56_13475 [Phocaeicola dorei]KAA5396721.1 hypothetical protein F2Y58_14510 [Phocaeicola dorei]KAA5404082.1 hypothetical protein F2Y51_13575 [Phocaeicola dorei]MDC2425663.1 hypothetical protein [Bacteroides ovatus]
MEQYYICVVLIVFLFLLFFHEIIRDYKSIKHPFRRILLCLVLTLVFKYNYGIFFYGLEYEDAYVFSFCARQFSYDIFPTSFLIDAVSVGSLTEPLLTSTYGGHFIMYPTYLSLFTKVLGWSPTILSLANTIIAFFVLLILSVFSKEQKFWFIPPIIYCCAPIINLFATCFLSEIFSSFICLIFVYTYFREKGVYNYILCLISFLVAIMCKRENLALLSLPAIEFIYLTFLKYRCNIKNHITELLKYIPFLFILCIYFMCIQNVFNIETIESKDIENATFSTRYMAILLPAFIKAMFGFEAFTLVLIITIAWIVYFYIRYKRITKSIAFPLILFCAYLILYTAHYRGYFFIQEKQVSSFETYRYINNFFYLIPLVFISLRCKFIRQIKLIACIVLAISLFNTYSLRLKMSETEYRDRFYEAQTVRDYIQANSTKSVLICENILLYQNICDDNFDVCDIRLYDKLDKNHHTDYYILLSDLNYLKERYSLNIDLHDVYPVMSLGERKYLYKCK